MPQLFNACEYLLDRRLAEGDGPRTALTGAAGDVSYAALHDQVRRTATALRTLGLQPEQRVLMLMADSPQFVVVYLAAMRMGAVPVPVSTMLKADGVAELLRDSRARFLAVTREFAATAVAAAAAAPELTAMLADEALTGATLTGENQPGSPVPVHLLSALAAGPPDDAVYPTTADSPAFWLYTSGTTGQPKAAMHRHGAIKVVCETYGLQVLGIRPGDRCLSAAKAFFAYGLGNSLLFPLSVGASAVLRRPRPVPAPSRTRPRNTARPCSSPGRRSSPTCSRPDWPRTRWPGCGWPPRRGRRCPRRCTSGGPRTSAWTSWTASA